MSEFSEEFSEENPTSVINAIDIKKEGNNVIITDENGQVTTLPFTDEALEQLSGVIQSLENTGGSRRRKSRKRKAVKRRNKSHRRHRRH
jgi:hypothetical protein